VFFLCLLRKEVINIVQSANSSNISKAEFNDKKLFAEQILMHKNMNYREWLHQKHLELIDENLTVLLDGLKELNRLKE